MKNLISMTLVSILLASCASQKSYVLQNHKSGSYDKKVEGEFTGVLNVNLDGKDKSKECYLDFRNNEEKFAVKVQDKGKFEGKAKQGQMYLDSIRCDGEKMVFKKDTITFENKSGSKVNFLGNLEVKWTTGGVNPVIAVIGLALGWIAIVNEADKFSMRNNDEGSSRALASNKYYNSYLKVPYGLWPNEGNVKKK